MNTHEKSILLTKGFGSISKVKVKYFTFVFLTTTFLSLITSCQKEKLTLEEQKQNVKPLQQNPPNNQITTTESEGIDDYVYIKDSVIIDESEVDFENDNTTLIYDENSNNVYVFDSDEKVRQWAISENSVFSNSVLTSLDKLVQLRNYIVTNNVEEYYEQNGTTPEGYDEFYNSLFGNGSMGKTVLNFLHDDPNAAINGTIWLPVSYPKLSVVNFNDRTSAVSIGVSAIWLFNHNWYRGSRAFFGALAQTYRNIGFNNIASSVIKL